jgi:peptidoglycan/xylan/chitin deacetylase (PgdA/CDA1 family)
MNRVTLTFDNGPTPGITEHVLEILDRAGLHSTFFVIGRKLEVPGAIALMQQAHAAGHWIGNHTLTHSVAFGDRPDAAYAAEELEQTQALLGDCARPEKLFRPYGNSGQIGPHLFSPAAVGHLLAGHYTTILWNCVPGDWKDPDGWLQTCLAQIAAEPNTPETWPVIVLHDIANGCLGHLPELLARLGDHGMQFEQRFPKSTILTRDGALANLNPTHIRHH